MIKRKVFYLLALALLGIGCWLFVTILFGYPGLGHNLLLTAGCWLFAIAIIWVARRLGHKIWIVAGLVFLVVLLLPASVLIRVFPNDQAQPFASSMALTLFLIMSLSLIIAAMLLSTGVSLYKTVQKDGEGNGAGGQVSHQTIGRMAVVSLLLGSLLLAKALHSLYWLTLWDNTYDGLGYIGLVFPFLAVFLAGLLLIVTLPAKAKVRGFMYWLFMPALLIVVSTFAQRVDFKQLTEERAERVSQALESYYNQKGHYPQDLNQLTPKYILSLPKPEILFGQDWCYDGGGYFYRLGYVYREHWSDPRLFGRIHSSTYEEAPHLPPLCEEEISALIALAPHYYEIKRE